MEIAWQGNIMTDSCTWFITALCMVINHLWQEEHIQCRHCYLPRESCDHLGFSQCMSLVMSCYNICAKYLFNTTSRKTRTPEF